jgi:hypothetical protein
MNNVLYKKFTKLKNRYSPADLSVNEIIQGDQKVSVHLMITVQKTRKNILNSFNHLP